MSTWDYRIVRKKCASQQNPHYFEIHEVYYNEQEEIESWTQDPISLFGNSEDELREDLLMMSEAFDHPILDEEELDSLLPSEATLKFMNQLREAVNEDSNPCEPASDKSE